MKATKILTLADKDQSGEYQIDFWTGAVVRVTLVDWNKKPLHAIAWGMRGFIGNYKEAMEQAEAEYYVQEAIKTKLVNSLEWVNMTFLVNNVPRTWTHQAVRYRVGSSFVQESTRFWDLRSIYSIFAPRSMCQIGNSGVKTIRAEFLDGAVAAIQNYRKLISQKSVIQEDARTMLPHCILTHIFWNINLRALINVFEKRFCCQAEPTTWLPFLAQVRREIKAKMHPLLTEFLSSPFQRGENCGFNSSIDRPCKWMGKNLVEIDQMLEEEYGIHDK